MPNRIPRTILPASAAVLLLAAAPSRAATDVVLKALPPSLNCPVLVTAEYRNAGSDLQPFDKAAPYSRTVHIEIKPTEQDNRTLQAADVTLYVSPLRPGATPASTQSLTPPPQTQKTFHIVRDPNASGTLSADLTMKHITGIRSIGIDALQYANGPAWHTSQASLCITAPKGTQLLGQVR